MPGTSSSTREGRGHRRRRPQVLDQHDVCRLGASTTAPGHRGPAAASAPRLRPAMHGPGVVGAEAGCASEEWVAGLYGDVGADGWSWLEDAVRAEFRASPFTFDGADQATVRPLERDLRMIEWMSDYRKYVAWIL